MGNAKLGMDLPQDALDLYSRALKLQTAVLDKDHLYMGHTHNNMGKCCSSLERFDEAMEHFVKASRIKKKHLGTMSLSYAASIEGMAFVHERRAEWDKALALLEQSKRINETLEGVESPKAKMLEKRMAYIRLMYTG
jgi:tetratricopeptide (TPR) repeat protein